MHDKALEREIEALLEIEPGPDFRARLRQRIAQEPPLRSATAFWRLSWSLAAAAAVVVAIGIGVSLVLVTTPTPSTELATRSVAPEGYAALPTAIAATRLSQRLSRRETTRSSRGHVPMELEVVIDPAEAAAWRRLLADMSAGRVELPPVADAAETRQPLPEGFLLAPVTIEPLTPDFREQGVHP